MKHRIFALIGLATVFATLLVLVSAASAHDATLRDVRLYKVAKGPDKGALVILARVDATGQLSDVRRMGDATVRLTLRLVDGRHRVTVRDTIVVGPAHDDGAAIRFRVELPAKQARLIDTSQGLRWTASLDRTRPRTRSTRQNAFNPFALMCRVLAGYVGGMPAARFGGCGGSFTPSPVPPPPPAPPVAFSTLSCNGLGYCTGGSMCVYFGGPNYSSPYVGFLQLTTDIPDSNNTAYVSSTGDGPQTYPVASDGSFSFAGSYTWYANGPTNAVTILGSVPIGILSAAPNASTGSATMTYAPAQQFVPTTIVAPLDQAVLTSLSALC